MELKGLKLHREDGTVDTYPFPIPTIIVNSGGGSTDSGNTETSSKLYVYKSGDADFVNCSYSAGSDTEVSLPPFNIPLAHGVAGEEITDRIRIRYLSGASSPSGYSYFNIVLNTTFADYNKLCIDACHVNKYYEINTDIIDMRCGFFNEDEDVNDGDIFYDTGYVYENVTRERKTHEFDISGCTVSRTISFLLVSEYPLDIYNIWLEK